MISSTLGLLDSVIIIIVVTGGYKKKQKLTEEFQLPTTAADTTGLSKAKELKYFGTKMSSSLPSLYGYY